MRCANSYIEEPLFHFKRFCVNVESVLFYTVHESAESAENAPKERFWSFHEPIIKFVKLLWKEAKYNLLPDAGLHKMIHVGGIGNNRCPSPCLLKKVPGG